MDLQCRDEWSRDLERAIGIIIDSSTERLRSEVSRDVKRALERRTSQLGVRFPSEGSAPEPPVVATTSLPDQRPTHGASTGIPKADAQPSSVWSCRAPEVDFSEDESGFDGGEVGTTVFAVASGDSAFSASANPSLSRARGRHALVAHFDRLMEYVPGPGGALVADSIKYIIEETLSQHLIDFKRLGETIDYIAQYMVKRNSSKKPSLSLSLAHVFSSGNKGPPGVGINREAFCILMSGDDDDISRSLESKSEDVEATHNEIRSDIQNLKKLFAREASHHETECLLQKLHIACHRTRGPGIGYDVIPAIVIVLNAGVLGFSQDFWPDSLAWDIIEICFALFYMVEFLVKVRFSGFKMFLHNGENWELWNCFDLLCLVASLFDLSFTLAIDLASKSSDANAFMLLKIFRVARLVRLIRTINNPVFNELKVMLLGVIAGLRTLFWAFVFLILLVYVLGVTMRIFVGPSQSEFRTVQTAMFTLFRCFIDGCDTEKGTPLSAQMYNTFGLLFGLPYLAVTMLVSMGVFNLITAVFIDNVALSQTHRRHEVLSKTVDDCTARLKKTISKYVIRNTMMSEDQQVMEALAKAEAARIEDIFEVVRASGFEVSRELFEEWLRDREFTDFLMDNDIECSNKSELFDVLDADMGDTLNLSEVITGLMLLRGPVTKGDITAISLKVRHVSGVLNSVLASLNLEQTSTRSSALGIYDCYSTK